MIDPFKNDNFTFDDPSHTYKLNGLKLQPTTKYIEQFLPVFDKEYWAEKKAKERGITVVQMLDEWDKKRMQAARKGTSVHRMIEEHLTKSSVRMSSNDEALIKYGAWMQWWHYIKKHYKVIFVEWRMYHELMELAGTVDLLIETNKGYSIIDWKTNAEISILGGYVNLNPPFEAYSDNDLVKYSLQLSTYKLMAENAGIKIQDMYIAHLTNSEVNVFKCHDFTEQLLGNKK